MPCAARAFYHVWAGRRQAKVQANAWPLLLRHWNAYKWMARRRRRLSQRIRLSAWDHHSYYSIPHSTPATPSGSTSIIHTRERVAWEAAGRLWHPSVNGAWLAAPCPPPPTPPLPDRRLELEACNVGWGRGRDAVDSDCPQCARCYLHHAHTHLSCLLQLPTPTLAGVQRQVGAAPCVWLECSASVAGYGVWALSRISDSSRRLRHPRSPLPPPCKISLESTFPTHRQGSSASSGTKWAVFKKRSWAKSGAFKVKSGAFEAKSGAFEGQKRRFWGPKAALLRAKSGAFESAS